MTSGAYIAAGFGLTAGAVLAYAVSLRARIRTAEAAVRVLRRVDQR